jgi:transcription initiation factor IIE alpha subunit
MSVIAEVTKINKNTINRIIQLLRARVVGYADEESRFSSGERLRKSPL